MIHVVLIVVAVVLAPAKTPCAAHFLACERQTYFRKYVCGSQATHSIIYILLDMIQCNGIDARIYRGHV